MALPASIAWEVEASGTSDTANGGGFDPGNGNMLTDGAATSATGNSPPFTSVSYTFVAGDVGAWLFIKSGSNWTPGWYKIASVSAGAATLNAAIGTAVSTIYVPNTVAGCATTASPTAATWTIDYSQQAAAQFSYTDLASTGAGLTVTSAAKPFGRQQVGNCLQITSGTNFTAGVYNVSSVSGTTATLVGPANSSTGVASSGVSGLGGAFASVGQIGAVKVSGNDMFVQSGTYTFGSTTANVATGLFSDTTGGVGNTNINRYEGYGTVRGDKGTKPILALPAGSGYNAKTLFTATGSYTVVDNLTADGNGNTSTTLVGFSLGANYQHVVRLKADRVATGITTASGNNWYALRCEANRCTANGFVDTVSNAVFDSCESHGGTGTCNGFSVTLNTLTINCLSYANGGNGYNSVSIGSKSINCVAYANSGSGWLLGSIESDVCINCISVNNTGYGWNSSGGASQLTRLQNCADYNNTSGRSVASAIVINENAITLTGDPFTNGAAGDFSLNTTAGAGAACRAAGYPGVMPAGTSTGNIDIGAIQHPDPAGGTSGPVGQCCC